MMLVRLSGLKSFSTMVASEDNRSSSWFPAQKQLTPFLFNDQKVTTLLDANGSPWWVAKEVCDILDLGNPRSSVALLDEDERGVQIMDTPGGPQKMSIINEPGLHSLIMRSRKPEAKAFKRWIMHTVIPEVRWTGGYSVEPSPDLNDPTTLRHLLLDYTQRVEEMLPKVETYERVINTDGAITLTNAGRCLRIRPIWFCVALRENRIMGINKLAREYTNEPMYLYLKKGYFTLKVFETERYRKPAATASSAE